MFLKERRQRYWTGVSRYLKSLAIVGNFEFFEDCGIPAARRLLKAIAETFDNGAGGRPIQPDWNALPRADRKCAQIIQAVSLVGMVMSQNDAVYMRDSSAKHLGSEVR